MHQLIVKSPRDPVLGPIIFNIYLLPIFDFKKKYPDINFHSFADDLLSHLNCTNALAYGSDRIANCISDLLK